MELLDKYRNILWERMNSLQAMSDVTGDYGRSLNRRRDRIRESRQERQELRSDIPANQDQMIRGRIEENATFLDDLIRPTEPQEEQLLNFEGYPFDRSSIAIPGVISNPWDGGAISISGPQEPNYIMQRENLAVPISRHRPQNPIVGTLYFNNGQGRERGLWIFLDHGWERC